MPQAAAPGDHDGAEVAVEVLRGAPDPEELAALMAVVTEAYSEETARATAEDTVARTAWSLSQRSVRQPLRRDLGWGRYG